MLEVNIFVYIFVHTEIFVIEQMHSSPAIHVDIPIWVDFYVGSWNGI